MAVKVYCDVEALRSAIAVERRISNETLMQEELRRRTLDPAKRLLELLKRSSSRYYLNEPVYQDLIMNGAFLVDEAKQKDFVAQIRKFFASEPKYLTFETSGPYPPYTFSEPPGES